ncbi:DUF4169 family protein [Paremcibacter congregatus]|uniref:DUF4169 domain-containing protein n=1 Tax=Paremcibacter congregatus TaxID=2043170 RepID=A0A2G4YM46_9PROT|nr:DUF4169 family protein [Paremcibacter congregatus]PHZ83399.1 DUF4169 domain-containing protein [Paremcibacter congregatus]QDE28131.1 DUF4169 family protein [Paremcibacter congregatus]
MGTVINLKQAKRKLAKIEKEKQASENRAKHGQTKAVKTSAKKINKRTQETVDAHKLNDPGKKDKS